MNEIEIKIDFTKGTLATKGIALITGDYASTMLKFTFDREDGTKIFEMKNPSDEVVYAGEIINGEVLLTSKVDATTIHNNKTYTKYTKNDAIYWYQPTDNKLFTDEWVEVVTFDLEEYTKVQVNASLFSESGKYIFEVSLYKNDTKLTSTKGILPVKQEQVIVGDEIVEAYIPIFDELIQEINEKITEANNLDLDVTDTSGVVEATLTKKDGTTKTVEIIDRNDYYDKDEVDAIQTTIETEIPTKVSELDNDSNFIDNTVNDLTNYTKTSDLGAVALSNDYDDLTDKPNLSIYSLITETGNKIDLEINSSTYVLTAKLYDKNNNLISTSTGIDLPLETMVVGASYDSATKEIILTLKNGQEVRFSVADLVSGLQTEITSDNMLSSDLVDDTNHTHKFVSSSDITNWNNKSDFSGSYNDLTNKPDLTLKEDKSNKVTSLSNTSTDTQYPSAKCVYDSQVSQDTQIEQLQEENTYLNNVIDQLPRVNGTGDTITLNNTIEAKMKSKLSPSELSQETTTGNNQIGLQNLSETTRNGLTFSINNGILSVNGTASAKVDFQQVLFNLTQNTSKTLKFYLDSGTFTAGAIGIHLNENENTQVSFIQINYNTTDLTSTKTIDLTNVNQVWLYAINGSVFNNAKFRVMLSDNATDTYEPYTNGASPNPQYPQTIHTTTGDNVIRDEGKNLINLTDGTYTNNGITAIVNKGKITLNGTASGTSFVSIPLASEINLLNQTITLSTNNSTIGGDNSTEMRLYTSGSYYLACTYNIVDNSATYTNRTNTFDRLQIRTSSGISYNNFILKPMLEKGSTKTSYEPYLGTDYPLTLGTLEYSKIGNYEDEFIYNTTDTNLQLNKWYLKKNIGKVVLDGSESWSDRPNYINADRFILDRTFPTNNRNMLCNYFQVNQSTDDTYPYLTNNGTQCLINFSEKGTTTLAQFKTWLSTHNTIVNYPLANPEYLPLNDTLQTQLTNIYNNMMSKKGTTNISQVNDGLPVIISASALLDLNTLVGN